MHDFKCDHLPPQLLYYPDRFKSSTALEAFQSWWEANKLSKFDFKTESEFYCLTDTAILAMVSEQLENISISSSNGAISILNSKIITLAGYL
jgi:hypothetical protein